MNATYEEIQQLMASDCNIERSVTPAEIAATQCPLCNVKEGACRQLVSGRMTPRNDFHAARKYAAVVEKRRPKEEENAVEEGVKQEGDLGEHPGDAEVGVSGEAGSGSQPVERETQQEKVDD